ncbi:hypothetical protein AB0B25_16515 [Nocardia sp. NPDC049190]|uniref:hypothetical protein n=1 Tax=Nocardia sp. NPDC049190 TaxID=3155650 RepID=UPI0033DC0681
MSDPFHSYSAIADRPPRQLPYGQRIAVNSEHYEYGEPGPAWFTAGFRRVPGFGPHPSLSGRPFRVCYAAEALEHVAGHDDVRLSTPDEIAAWHVGGAA